MRDKLIAVAVILAIVTLIVCQATVIAKRSSCTAPIVLKTYHVAGASTAEEVVPTWSDRVLR